MSTKVLILAPEMTVRLVPKSFPLCSVEAPLGLAIVLSEATSDGGWALALASAWPRSLSRSPGVLSVL